MPISFAVLAAAAVLAPAPQGSTPSDEGRILIRNVAVSSQHIVFSYAGDLWRVDREGGVAERLTSGPEDDDFPVMSRTGNIAFSRRAADDWDVYVIPAPGGQPRRLTYNPGPDIARAWNVTGDTVIFMSQRDEEFTYRLYAVGRDGTFPVALPFPRAWDASFASEGGRVAYVPTAWPADLVEVQLDHYRGGMTSSISVVDLGSGDIVTVPREDSSDLDPEWMGDAIYFRSDRSGTFNLYRYGLETGLVEPLTEYEGYGVESISAAGGFVAFVRDGRIHVYNTGTAETETLEIRVAPDSSELATRAIRAAGFVQSGSPSRSGDQVLFGMRGEVVSYDVATGEYSNLTNTSGVAERFPLMSPDGESIAYFSDETGVYQLLIRPTSGEGPVTKIPVELKPTFYRELVWSPDSKHVAFSDKELTLWVADVETGGARKVTTSTQSYQDLYQPAWSPDGSWLAYSRYEANRIRAVYLYNPERARLVQLTDGRVDSEHPVFDASGKYLYFVASNTAPLGDFNWNVLSGALLRPYVSRTLQVVVLRDGLAAPTYPVIGAPNPAADSIAAPPDMLPGNRRELPQGRRPPPGRSTAMGPPQGGTTVISLGNISDRIVPLPLSRRDFAALVPGDPGELFVLLSEWRSAPGSGAAATQTLYRYQLSEPTQLVKLVEDIDEFALTTDKSKILYRRGADWAMVPSRQVSGPEDGHLDLSAIQLDVDPAAEWAQLFHETWRLLDDYFYDPNFHGQNLSELESHYATYLPSVTRRRDLNLLLARALAHLSVTTLRVSGGDLAAPGPGSQIGLLGADYEIDQGLYRISRIYRSGTHSHRDSLLSAPLDQPGVYVLEGDYLLAVDGTEVTAGRNLFSYFTGKALKPTQITVRSDLKEGQPRTYTVIPLPNESYLRRWNWAERNRRIVAEESQGILGYVYVPDFGSRGLQVVFQQLLANSDQRGLIIDQRFSVGGMTADFLFELLQRAPLYYYAFREGDNLAVPPNPLPKSKVLLVNDVNGSAAETFALMFKLGRAGRIVGTRTLGSGIELYAPVPRLIDGGEVDIPSRAAFNPAGSWDIANHGVVPDIEVPLTVQDWWAGQDPQLGTAIRTVLQMIVDNPPLEVTRPDYPVYP